MFYVTEDFIVRNGIAVFRRLVFQRVGEKIGTDCVCGRGGRFADGIVSPDDSHRRMAGGGGGRSADRLRDDCVSTRFLGAHCDCIGVGRACGLETLRPLSDVCGIGRFNGDTHSRFGAALLSHQRRTGRHRRAQPVDCFLVLVNSGLFRLWVLRRLHRYGGRYGRKPDCSVEFTFSWDASTRTVSHGHATASRPPPSAERQE